MAEPEMVELCMTPEVWANVRRLIERTWPDLQAWRMPTQYEEGSPEVHAYALRARERGGSR